MTALLASVRDADEAALALTHGADIIDLKNPSAGALGALPLRTITALARWVGGRRPVSATIGDLPMVPGVLRDVVSRTAKTGVDFVKVGLFAHPERRASIASLAMLARESRLVGVLFADQGLDLALLDALARAGFTGVMLDTASKRAGSLRRHVSDGEIGEFVRGAARLGLASGLAGSLGLEDIAPLAALGPTCLGFRGALCANGTRTQRLDAGAFAAVREHLNASTLTALRKAAPASADRAASRFGYASLSPLPGATRSAS